MVFIAVKGGKKLKTFKVRNANTVYNQFNKYCKDKGYTSRVMSTDSFGYVAWSNGTEAITLQRLS